MSAVSRWVVVDLHQITRVLLADGEWHAVSKLEYGDLEFQNGTEAAFQVRPRDRQNGISWMTEDGARVTVPVSAIQAVRQR